MSLNCQLLLSSSAQPYFDKLFGLADVTGAGKIGGSSAVSFLTKSGLPLPALKNIWSLSDTSGSHVLNKGQFYIAVRFIQILQTVMAQTGSLQNVRITADLLRDYSTKELRAPRFDGVELTTGPAVSVAPVPSMATLASTFPTTVISDQYAMTASGEAERGAKRRADNAIASSETRTR